VTVGARVRVREEGRTRVERILWAGVCIAAAGVMVQTAAHLVNVRVLDGEVWSLSADVDGNAFAWASAASTLAAAFLAAALALLLPRRAHMLWLLAALLAFLSLDDIARIHETTGRWVVGLSGADLDYSRLVWPVLFLPILLACWVLLLRTAGTMDPRSRRALYVGLGALGAALAAEAVSTAWIANGAAAGSWPDAIEVVFEEGAELAGWILISSALAATAVGLVEVAANPPLCEHAHGSSPVSEEVLCTACTSTPAPATMSAGREFSRVTSSSTLRRRHR
jgi:hypothetical protein